MSRLGSSGGRCAALTLTAYLLACGCTDRSLVTTPPGTGGGGGSGIDGGEDGSPIQSDAGLQACPAIVTCVPDCRGMPPCWKTCGPARSGRKDCTCDEATGSLVCAACTYAPAQDTSCFALPDPVPACPPGPAGELPMAASACQLEACHPCGSRSAPGYADSSGAPKAGFCVCWLSPDAGAMVYTCASPADWPSEVQASPLPEDEVVECLAASR